MLIDTPIGVTAITHNTILEELYVAREKLLAAAGGDIHKYLEGVYERQAASGRLLPFSPQKIGENACRDFDIVQPLDFFS